MYASLTARKQSEASRRSALAASLSEELAVFAVERGGRYVLFGSAVRGTMRYDSDIDLLVDFPAEAEAEAWHLAEEICARHRVELDIKPLAWCDPAFLAKIIPAARTIG